MARHKHEHEDHVNHEAWAIPYGDLVTLLLAFFVVMYAVSSVNEGKYRVLSDSMQAAFRGSPRTTAPIQIGDKVVKVRRDDTVAGFSPSQAMKLPDLKADEQEAEDFSKMGRDIEDKGGVDGPGLSAGDIAAQVEQAMASLISKDLVTVTRKPRWVEVEIKTDILFPSGSAEIQTEAIAILNRIADILKPLPSPIRVEGHTDNRPINTPQFPSNWELSGARASRIVRLFENHGVAPDRMSVAGLGEYQPVGDNSLNEGRNRNRRVTLIILDSMTGEATDAAQTAGNSPAAESLPAESAPAADALPAGTAVTASREVSP